MSRFTWGWTSRFQAHSSVRLFVGFPRWPLPSLPEHPFYVAAGSPEQPVREGKRRGEGERTNPIEEPQSYNLVLEVPSHHFHCFLSVTWPSSGPLMVGLHEGVALHKEARSWGWVILAAAPRLAHRHRSCSFLFMEGIKAGQIRTGGSGKSQGVRKTISQKEVIGRKQKGERLPRMNI